jgi:hypothetical protein
MHEQKNPVKRHKVFLRCARKVIDFVGFNDARKLIKKPKFGELRKSSRSGIQRGIRSHRKDYDPSNVTENITILERALSRLLVKTLFSGFNRFLVPMSNLSSIPNLKYCR